MATFNQQLLVPKASRDSNREEEEIVTNNIITSSHVVDDNESDEQLQQLLLSLPKTNCWGLGDHLYLFQGFWCSTERVVGTLAFQQNFQAFDTDQIIATYPRSGTLWLKAITFTIVNRTRYHISSKQHPLLTHSPHNLVPFAEYKSYYDHVDDPNSKTSTNLLPNHSFADFQSPNRLISTHIPYTSLPESIKNTNCKIVYLCRNPKDTFISAWKFLNKWRVSLQTTDDNVDNPVPLEEAFDSFCNGISRFGPFWNHALGYWKESLERPGKVLFVMYEDMKKDPKSNLKRLAEFLGDPFSLEEESEGVIEEILSLCSFEHLRNLDVNKEGIMSELNFKNEILFGKAQVGDWKNYLTPSMVERLDRVIEEKLHGSGLVFQDSIN